MARKTLHMGLILLAAGVLNLAGCPLPAQPVALSQAILDMEQRVLDQVNEERSARGLTVLVMDEALREVARAHSEDRVARGFFSHINPDGQDPFDRMADAGITYSWAGENLAMNNTRPQADVAVASWMISESHRENLFLAQFNRAGVGVAGTSAGLYYFTMDFIGTDDKSDDAPQPWREESLEPVEE